MRSIGTRLAVWYALASAATLTLAVVGGYFLLRERLARDLDAVNRTEFQQLRSALRPDFAVLEPEAMLDRLRAATETTSALFYVELSQRYLGVIFSSDNLHNLKIPETPDAAAFSVTLQGAGRLRIGRFRIGMLTVLVGSSMEPAQQVLAGYLEVAAGGIAVLVLISCAVGFVLSRIALRPVRAIRETAEHIGRDNLSERIPVGAVQDEISNLARLLNRTFDRLERAFNQVRQFSAEASHELKTPLALARAHAEKLIASRRVSGREADAAQDILEELSRLEKIIDELLLLSRAEAHAVPLELRVLDVQAFIRSFAVDARALGEYRGIEVVAECTGEGSAEFDPKWIRQVLFNLVTNALRVSPRAGRVRITSEVEPEAWRLAVEDEGPGVPPDQLERIFERFVRLRSPTGEDSGSGLGLPISRSIVGLHHGAICAEPRQPRGLRVIIRLPAREAGARRVRADGNVHARAADIAG